MSSGTRVSRHCWRSRRATETFGEDQLQELLALFTNPHGDGIRNQVAHGLIGDDEVLRNEAIYVYVWWFALRMMVGELPPGFKLGKKTG